MEIPLGYEVGTGERVSIPIHHLIVTGLTRLSGKTTTLEALLTRSKLRGVVFRTKRGEIEFQNAHFLPLYFKEKADWAYVSSLLEARMRERMRFERGWIIQACKGASSLRGVYENICQILRDPKLRDFSRKIYTELQAYLELILPEIEKLNFAKRLELREGLNVMDLVGIPEEVQLLIIRSTLEYVYENERDVVVVIPEAWKMLPQNRSSPVKDVVEHLIREGGAVGIWIFLDAQDVAGVDKRPLKSVSNWLLGRQREINEVIRVIDQIPLPKSQKPKPEEVMSLKLGHFIVCCEDFVKHVYVQPVWLDDKTAKLVALGKLSVEEARERRITDVEMLKAEVEKLRSELTKRDEVIAKLKEQLALKPAPTVEIAQPESKIEIELPDVIKSLDEDARVLWALLRHRGPLPKTAIIATLGWPARRVETSLRTLKRRRLIKIEGRKLRACEPLVPTSLRIKPPKPLEAPVEFITQLWSSGFKGRQVGLTIPLNLVREVGFQRGEVVRVAITERLGLRAEAHSKGSKQAPVARVLGSPTPDSRATEG